MDDAARPRLYRLFSEIGEEFEKLGVAEPFCGCHTRQPAVYKAQNIHGFYRLKSKPQRAIYAKGDVYLSRRSAVISAYLVDDKDKWKVEDEIYDLTEMGAERLSAADPEEMEAAFKRLVRWNSLNGCWNAISIMAEIRLPYGAEEIVQEILWRKYQRNLE